MEIKLAGIKVDNITMDEAITKLDDFITSWEALVIAPPNPEMIVSPQQD